MPKADEGLAIGYWLLAIGYSGHPLLLLVPTPHFSLCLCVSVFHHPPGCFGGPAQAPNRNLAATTGSQPQPPAKSRNNCPPQAPISFSRPSNPALRAAKTLRRTPKSTSELAIVALRKQSTSPAHFALVRPSFQSSPENERRRLSAIFPALLSAPRSRTTRKLTLRRASLPPSTGEGAEGG